MEERLVAVGGDVLLRGPPESKLETLEDDIIKTRRLINLWKQRYLQEVIKVTTKKHKKK